MKVRSHLKSYFTSDAPGFNSVDVVEKGRPLLPCPLRFARHVRWPQDGLEVEATDSLREDEQSIVHDGGFKGQNAVLIGMNFGVVV